MRKTAARAAATVVVAVAALAACGSPAVRDAVTAPTMVPQDKPGAVGRLRAALPGGKPPPMAWEGQAQSEEWTAAMLDALETEGVTLMSSMPADVLEYCPGYQRQTPQDRAAFWAGFMSKVAGQESGWNPLSRRGEAVGLLGVTARAARSNGCATSLSDVRANLQCGVRIMARNVARDGAISAPAGGEGRSWRGAARDLLTLRSGKERGELATWTRRQDYCR
ncbi:lytic transglycosylase [Paracoccus marinus]|uniref:lytic transglycosylase n=1 Tax=Paracoccus marinus TaxID=288426 RepID=UPI00103A0FF5|nr:lytic transglycosylase [Paracoccus marinus]GLS81843.1 hypothetical protein GCM10007893_26840 [Paracoccus marinus]